MRGGGGWGICVSTTTSLPLPPFFFFSFFFPARQIYFWLLTSLVSCDGASSQSAAPSQGAARVGWRWEERGGGPVGRRGRVATEANPTAAGPSPLCHVTPIRWEMLSHLTVLETDPSPPFSLSLLSHPILVNWVFHLTSIA